MSDRIVIGDHPLLAPTEYARRLRSEETDAERQVWQRLRNRALGVKFRRQHPFAGYILDFCCLERRLVIELDGDQHAEPEAVRRDAQRDQTLQRLGFHVVRFGNRQVLTEPSVVLEAIRSLLDQAVLDEKLLVRGSTTPSE